MKWARSTLEVIIGSLTFTGSLIAAGKLQEFLPQRPIVYRGQNIVSLSVLAGALGLAVALVVNPGNAILFPIMVIVALGFGVLLVTPIGGALPDMPTVSLAAEFLRRAFHADASGICSEQQSARCCWSA